MGAIGDDMRCTPLTRTAVLLAGLVSLGCTGPQRRAELLDLNKERASVVTMPADLRTTYLLTDDEQQRFCAEPSPDVAMEALRAIEARYHAAHGPGGLSGEASSRVMELAGRSQLVMVARELLYRACELSVNHPDTGHETAIEMYGAVVDLIRALGSGSTGSIEPLTTESRRQRKARVHRLLSQP